MWFRARFKGNLPNNITNFDRSFFKYYREKRLILFLQKRNLSQIDQFFSQWNFTFDRHDQKWKSLVFFHRDKRKIPCKSHGEFLSFSRVKFESLLHVEILNFEPLYHNENLAKFFSKVTSEKFILKVTVNFFFFTGKIRIILSRRNFKFWVPLT